MTRIASFAHHNMMTSTALENQRRVYNLQAQITGKYKSETYSGIAGDSQRVVNLESQVGRIKRYVKNGETAELRLQTMENAIDNMTKLATRLRSLLLQASSGKQAKDLDLPNQARAMLQTVKSSLNTRLDGRYLFAGANTDRAPVDLDRMVTPAQKFAGTTLDSATSPLSGTSPNVTGPGVLMINGQQIPYDPATDSLDKVASDINADATLKAQNVTAYVDKTGDGRFRLVVEDADGDKVQVSEGTTAGGASGDLVAKLNMTTGAILRKNTAYYTGDQQKLGTRLDENLDLQYGVLANEGGFESLIRALKITEVSTDLTSLNHALTQVTKAITELPNIRAGIGADLVTIGEMSNQQKNFQVFAENAISDMKNVDSVHATALLAQEKTAVEAAYKAIGSLSSLSLAQYLR